MLVSGTVLRYGGRWLALLEVVGVWQFTWCLTSAGTWHVLRPVGCFCISRAALKHVRSGHWRLPVCSGTPRIAIYLFALGYTEVHEI